MTRLIGAHTVDVGGIHMAALRAGKAGMRSLQLFTAPPRFYGDRSSIRPERAQRFMEALATTDIRPEHVLVHAAYVVQVATSDEGKWTRSVGGLVKELERSSTIGAGGVCFHPGSAGSGSADEAAERVGRAIVEILERGKGATRLLVENTAGAGKTVGRSAAEIGSILASVPAALRPRTGYGLDTCHLFASGYPIHESRERLRSVLDEFEDACGEPPSFFHLNDSETELGSNRDRHALLGEGRIGVEPFRWLLEDDRSADVPLVLETPQRYPEPAADDVSADPDDLRMVELLASFS
jgi:deoxyribonuclease IV